MSWFARYPLQLLRVVCVASVISVGDLRILQVVNEVQGFWFDDSDCDHIRGSLIDWKALREDVIQFDLEWNAGEPPPTKLCPLTLSHGLFGTASQDWGGEAGFVIRWPEDSVDECDLGALAATTMMLVCASDCGAGNVAIVWERLFRSVLLEGSWQEAVDIQEHPRRPVYLLGTSVWPIASLLTKWSLNCTRRSVTRRLGLASCLDSHVGSFVQKLHAIAMPTLLPLLAGPRAFGALIFDARLDSFAMRALEEFSWTRSELPRDHPIWSASPCKLGTATREALLLFIRLLGPNVPQRDIDPIGGVRLKQFSTLLSAVPLATLLRVGTPLLAMLAATAKMTWRSRRLYPGAQVALDDVRRVLAWGANLLPEIATSGDLLQAIKLSGFAVGADDLRRRLWEAAASRRTFTCSNEVHRKGAPPLGAAWRRVARWLLQAPAGVPAVVFFSMFWGHMGSDQWVSRFLKRALSVGIKRFAFVSPEDTWLLDCDLTSKRDRLDRSEGYRRLLCLRSFSPFQRPYDVNNYAKFVFLPLLLSLGVDYAWLDIDIFLVRDPTARLLELAYGRMGTHDTEQKERIEVDILTTDHFDQTCLNHGVFFVKASDRTLLWALHYIEWLHVYPFGHDQNGWDAFLRHSIRAEPLAPIGVDVVLQVLDTGIEFLTLTGWAGSESDFSRVLLLHMTRTTPIEVREKREGLIRLFEISDVGNVNVSVALRELLVPLSTPVPSEKLPCYEGIHVSVEPLVDDGGYWKLFD